MWSDGPGAQGLQSCSGGRMKMALAFSYGKWLLEEATFLLEIKAFILKCPLT